MYNFESPPHTSHSEATRNLAAIPEGVTKAKDVTTWIQLLTFPTSLFSTVQIRVWYDKHTVGMTSSTGGTSIGDE